MHVSHRSPIGAAALLAAFFFLARPAVAQTVPTAPAGGTSPGFGGAGSPPPGIAPAPVVPFEPGSTVYVVVDSLPLFDGIQMLPHRFRRGDELKVAEVQRNPSSLFAVEIEFGQGDARRYGYVSRLGLSRQKPPPHQPQIDQPPAAPPPAKSPPEAPPAADDPAHDVDRLEGVWAVAGILVMGRANPGPMDALPTRDVVALLPSGVVDERRQNEALPVGLVAPQREYYQFHAGKMHSWSRPRPPEEAGKADLQASVMTTASFRLDVRKTPRRLDITRAARNSRFNSTTHGIYSWQDGVLVWAFAPAIGGLINPATVHPRTLEKLRPEGFEAEQLRKAVVVYLVRIGPPTIGVPKPTVRPPVDK